MSEAKFFLVGTPIGNLGDISIRALETLKSVDLIYCEDTRRSLKLLNHYEVSKPLRSCPYFKERKGASEILEHLAQGQRIAYVTDAGMPGVSDPGSILLEEVRAAGFDYEIIGGVSALTHFLAGVGRELDSFYYVGFLPEKSARRRRLFEELGAHNLLFFESTHRLETSLKILQEIAPDRRLSLGKEFTKISEAFFEGRPADLLAKIPSWKGEWVGLWWKP